MDQSPLPDPVKATSDELRTYWALERTYLAWIRTSLALMGFGFLVARFGLFARQLLDLAHDGELPVNVVPSGSFSLSVGIGAVLVVVGSVVSLFAVVQYRTMLVYHQGIRRAAGYAPHFQQGMGLFLIVLGLALAAHLLNMSH